MGKIIGIDLGTTNSCVAEWPPYIFRFVEAKQG